MAELTSMLKQWRAGDRSVERAVLAEIYPLLRGLAHREVPANGHYTLQPTELAHEAYLKLLEQRKVDWQDRGHFYAIASRLVRQVVIDYLRERHKRGAQVDKLPLQLLTESDQPAVEGSMDWLELDAALSELERVDADAAELVELRYFAGLSVAAIAQQRGVSEATIARQWRTTRAWLEVRLNGLLEAPHQRDAGG
jgi:RNA polymerase sigma factor (TIGR02999 family)